MKMPKFVITEKGGSIPEGAICETPRGWSVDAYLALTIDGKIGLVLKNPLEENDNLYMKTFSVTFDGIKPANGAAFDLLEMLKAGGLSL